uniref:Ig-like domain-containing protein n=1 Tax=Heterorhabditis bacteriophora TaxID=37862 RepID=A0A1I7XRB3_HETBA
MSMCGSLVEAPQLSFEQGLEDQEVVWGQSVTLQCTVYGAPQVEKHSLQIIIASISWFHRGRRVMMHPGAAVEGALPMKRIGSGLVESRLHIPCVNGRSVGEYMCEASTPCGQAITSHAKLTLANSSRGKVCNATVNHAPWISLITVSRLELVGTPVQMMCRAKGKPLPEIKWQRITDDDELEDIDGEPGYMSLSNGDLLVVGEDSTVTESFRCTATNVHGTTFADSIVVYVDED